VGFAQLIKKKLTSTPVTDRKLLEHAEMLWSQAQRLSRLIDTFVDLAYIERGEFALNPGKVDIVSLLKGATVQARELARGNPPIELDLPAHSLWVHADSRRLERVFIHILSNAIQHSPEGQPVKVVCRHDSMSGKVLIKVTDRGPGIPPARLQSIFDRSGRQEVPGSGGLGIGLYISKAIVEAHGGQISIDSSPKQGTSVSISLPV
jgi:signal transduction histidine kinase